MKLYSIYHPDTFFFLENDFFEDGKTPNNSTAILHNTNFIKPKFDLESQIWIEGATSEELNSEWFGIYMQRLQEKVIYLRMRAKAVAINKEGSASYINSQQELYELKFKVANGELSNTYIASLIENESVEFGLSLEDFKNLIISMYNNSLSNYQIFLFMIERSRTKIQTLIENQEWEKVIHAFELADSLATAEEAQTVMTNILAI